VYEYKVIQEIQITRSTESNITMGFEANTLTCKTQSMFPKLKTRFNCI